MSPQSSTWSTGMDPTSEASGSPRNPSAGECLADSVEDEPGGISTTPGSTETAEDTNTPGHPEHELTFMFGVLDPHPIQVICDGCGWNAWTQP